MNQIDRNGSQAATEVCKAVHKQGDKLLAKLKAKGKSSTKPGKLKKLDAPTGLRKL
jgi:hypothetical protein